MVVTQTNSRLVLLFWFILDTVINLYARALEIVPVTSGQLYYQINIV